MVIPVALGGGRDYEVTIDSLESIKFNRKVVVVTNPTVSALHLDYLLSKISATDLSVVTIPDGEQYKTMESILEILEHSFENRIDRKSLFIALGGGVIGDMTGFASSIYQRGVDFIQVPTTLLSQVDASVGGKTGINNKYGKNLIGAFHQPRAVYIDTHFLSTLPKREFAAGVAEIIKMGVMFDKEFFEWLEHNRLDNDENIKKAIARCVELKAEVVIEDEKEKGLRAALNYGHTFAHVIENETKYETYLHGEAVAIGMAMANDLSVTAGLLDRNDANRIKTLLESYDLPVSYNISSVDNFYDHFFLDKKSFDSKITFILPKGLGDRLMTNMVDISDVKRVLKNYA